MYKNVLITRKIPQIGEDILRGANFQVTLNEGEPLSKQELKKSLFEYDAILSMLSDKFTADMFPDNPRARLISNYAIGTDNIDLQAAEKSNIAICNVPDAVTDSTADMAMGLLLTYIRNIHAARDYVVGNNWKVWDPMLFLGNELKGKVIGIVGFGRVGMAIAKRAVAFGMQVLFATRRKVDVEEQNAWQAKQVTLKELLSKSDVVSLNVPLTSETIGMISMKELSLMKKEAILINMSRGAVIKTSDLEAALMRGDIRAALLDVTDPEPIREHPILLLDNCFIVPHIGTSTIEARNNMAEQASKNIVKFFS